MRETSTGFPRTRALDYLEKTLADFLDTAAPLSAGQWRYRPAEGAWSIAEIAEHLSVIEAEVLSAVERRLAGPPLPGDPPAETEGKDDMILTRLPLRERRLQSPGNFAPIGRWSEPEDVVREFRTRRGRTVAFLAAASADLRAFAFPHPFLGQLDCYQWILMLAAHSERHVAQMKDVIALPEFPRAA